jgi:hypothetical protein
MEPVVREDMAVHLECSMWGTSVNLRPAQAYFNDVAMTHCLNPCGRDPSDPALIRLGIE